MAHPLSDFTLKTTLAEGLHVDIKTRSVCDHRKVDPRNYTENWSTDVWVAGYAMGHDEVKLWHPEDPVPEDLTRAIESGLPFISYDAPLMFAVFTNIMGPRYGWPVPSLEQWVCTAAMAAAMDLPPGLDAAARVMGIAACKDREAHSLLLGMARPRSRTKVRCFVCGMMACDHHAMFKTSLTWCDDAEDLARLDSYCTQDLRTERALCDVLRPLSQSEREIWLRDQVVNERGMGFDNLFSQLTAGVAEGQAVTTNVEGSSPDHPGSTGRPTEVRASTAVRLEWYSELTMDDARHFIPKINSDGDAIASPDVGRVGGIISDRYLNRAIGACCANQGRLVLSRGVKDLIIRCSPADQPTMNAIPQERRRQFLAELASITRRALPPDEPVRSEPPLADQDKSLIINGNGPVGATPILARQDAKLIVNGYEPIAVKGKAPVATGWNTRLNTVEAITAERADHPSAASTGLRTGRLAGVDIDIIPTEHVQAVKNLAFEVLGFALLERVGAKGAMLCYRNETPIRKMTVSGNHPVQPGKIEILGSGQQFVGYGIHPDTGKPYTWTNALLDGEPLRTPFDKLPAVTPDKLHTFADKAAALLRGLGYTDVKISGRGEAPERVPLDAPADLEFDAPANVERARTRLRSLVDQGDVAVEGKGGDDRTYQVACELRDLGLSPNTALELLLEPGGWNEHCVRPWDCADLAIKVRNAYKYAKNPPGVDGIPSFPVELPLLEVAGATTTTRANNLVERFRGRWPDEYEALAEMQFWDDDKTLPFCPDGCIAIVYGEFGAHKTNTVLAMVLDAVLDEGARVCYAAGEGAHGVGKDRIPAHCTARGITTQNLRGLLRVVSAVPLFASADQVTAFIEAQQDLNPNIVVLDTLATVLAGEDENSSKAAAFLTANGPAGQIRDAFNALVILPAHQGKDASKKVRGHSGFMGNADVVLRVDADKTAGAIKVTVEKMRDGRDGFSIFFKVPPAGSPGVPVPEKITEEEYLKLMGKTGTRPSEAELMFNLRRDILVDHGAVSFDRGLPEAHFAEILAGPRPGGDDVDALAKWRTRVAQERTSLKNAHSKKHYQGVLCSQRVPTGDEKMQWRWYIVNPEAADSQAAPQVPVDVAALFASIDHGNGMPSSGGASAAGYPSKGGGVA